MNLPDKGGANKYTRDITRLTFHPHAIDEDELSDMVQSNLQSSLLDAVIIVKANQHLVELGRYPGLLDMFQRIDSTSFTIDEIAAQYLNDGAESESNFYKRSSAWLENNEIVAYRTLPDHFYDVPEASYFKLTESVVERASDWARPLQLSELADCDHLTEHEHETLRTLENRGLVTRSAMFNLILHRTEGIAEITDDKLFKVLGRTRDLAKTVNPTNLRNLALSNSSTTTKLLLYLLIARKVEMRGMTTNCGGFCSRS